MSGSDFIVENRESGNIRIYNNGGERMRITSSGNIGIDVSAPDSYNSSARKLVVGGSGNSGITISTSSTNMGTLMFADGTGGTAGYRGRVSYDHNGDYMRFDTAASEKMRITSSGAVGIGTQSPAFALHVSTTIGTRTLSLGHGTSYGIITTDAAKDLYFQQNGSTVFSLPSSGGLQMYGNTLKFDQTGTRSWSVFANYGYLNVAAGDALGAFNLEGYTNFRINKGGIGYPRTNSINIIFFI